ncbi:N-6 DNA methylase [Kribbella antiqua]|uniref:N-6 DNA methylase n=1 Tax=Kribbella antiqua TaxID=2512217 RepID=A0A4R2IFZ1_9ACTN|nr:N-6 DNA methylase [Kribbella antiqua]
MRPTQRDHLRDHFASGYELVDGTGRLAAMNLLLHGIGTPDGDSLIEVRDALIADPGERSSVVLSNPPFGQTDVRCVRTRDRAAGLRRHDEQQAAQLPAAHHDDSRHQRPRSRLTPGQRALRRRSRRNTAPQTAGRLSTCTPCCAYPRGKRGVAIAAPSRVVEFLRVDPAQLLRIKGSPATRDRQVDVGDRAQTHHEANDRAWLGEVADLGETLTHPGHQVPAWQRDMEHRPESLPPSPCS